MYVGQPRPAHQAEGCAILHDSTGTASPQNIGNRHYCALHLFIHKLTQALAAAYGSFSYPILAVYS